MEGTKEAGLNACKNPFLDGGILRVSEKPDDIGRLFHAEGETLHARIPVFVTQSPRKRVERAYTRGQRMAGSDYHERQLLQEGEWRCIRLCQDTGERLEEERGEIGDGVDGSCEDGLHERARGVVLDAHLPEFRTLLQCAVHV